jgi:hypothetical protein
MAAYSEGKLLAAVVYQVEWSWVCGGSEFLVLVGVPGLWAPERFKPYVGAYKNTSSACPGTEAKTTQYTTTWPADGTTLTFANPEDAQHFEKGATVAVASESAKRKAMPVCTGVLDYFGAALLEVSKLSKFGGDKHAPGQPLHHARGVSADHPDALMRHLMERGTIDPDSGLSHSVGVAWRALAMLQEELEAAGAPMARGAKVAK